MRLKEEDPPPRNEAKAVRGQVYEGMEGTARDSESQVVAGTLPWMSRPA